MSLMVRVDQDAATRDLAGERLGERDDRPLARRVVHHLGAANLAELRGNVDDPAPPAPEHRPDEHARDQEGAAQVDCQHAVPVGDGHVLEQRLGEDAGVVDQDVHPAVRVGGGGRRRPHRGLVRDVGPVVADPSTQPASGVHDRGRRCLVDKVDQRNVGTLTREAQGDSGADTRSRAGHERHPPGQTSLAHGLPGGTQSISLPDRGRRLASASSAVAGSSRAGLFVTVDILDPRAGR